MEADGNDLTAILEADTKRRAAQAVDAKAASDPRGTDPASHPERVRLMGGWPREAWPTFDATNQVLQPYGYALSPLHPLPSGRAMDAVRALQTELYRPASPSDAPFAPLLFALDEQAAMVRVFVQQFGGRQAPDFAERHVNVHDAVDGNWLAATLKEYVACMLRPRLRTAA